MIPHQPMSSFDHIKLDQFLKQMQVVASGGQAKVMVQGGEVQVNGEVEIRRGRKLVNGDRVEVAGEVFTVDLQGLL
ncbi:RNA-binding protein S4 [Leptolyngbya sp. BL0902]|nr:RNA-binding protein S4 [Leptolyngbya sp. BL0902]